MLDPVTPTIRLGGIKTPHIDLEQARLQPRVARPRNNQRHYPTGRVRGARRSRIAADRAAPRRRGQQHGDCCARNESATGHRTTRDLHSRSDRLLVPEEAGSAPRLPIADPADA